MRINIKNFQSISEADLEIGPVTVLVGASDIGKSAIIRAMSLLHRNSGGLELVKHGTSGLSVEQISDDAPKVSIVKGKGQNAYCVGTKVFSKVGKDIPPEVSEILKTSELFLDKDLALDLNFSGQFAPPFLLSDSSSVITKAISSLSGINVIYSAIREANSEAQKLKSRGDILSESIKGLLKYDQLYNEAQEVKGLFDSLMFVGENIEKYRSNVYFKKSRYEDVCSLEQKFISTLRLETSYSMVTALQEPLLKAYKRRDSLKACKDKLFGISEYTLTQDYVDNIDSIASSVDKLAYVQTIISGKKDKLSKFKDTFSTLNEIETSVTSKYAEQTKLENEYLEIKSQIKICESCGRPL